MKSAIQLKNNLFHSCSPPARFQSNICVALAQHESLQPNDVTNLALTGTPEALVITNCATASTENYVILGTD